MAKYIKNALIAVMTTILTAGCNMTECLDNEEMNGRKVVVYASIYPVYDFACKIGGEKAEVHSVLPVGAEAHDWEPSPSDIAGMSRADIFVYSGAGMEHWVEAVLPTLTGEDVFLVEASDGAWLIDDGKSDPHIWLSVSNAKKEMENIKDALVKADPENGDYYETNFTKYGEQFDSLDSDYRMEISQLPGRQIVVSHAAYAYLCRDYGLEQIVVEGMAPHSEPDAAAIAETIDFMRVNDVKVIFFEETMSPKVAEIVAKETGGSAERFSALESLSDEQANGGDDYLSVMRQNLEAIKKALS